MTEDKCITNSSSAMAMIYDSNNPLFQGSYNAQSDVSKIKSVERNEIGKLDFAGEFWMWKNSLESSNIDNLILDRRWEELPTFATRSTKSKGTRLDYLSVADISTLSNLTIPFSLQIDKEAHIFLCDGDRVSGSNCYWFLLYAWDGTKSAIRKCRIREIQQYYNGKAPAGSCNTPIDVKKHTSPTFLSQDQWNHLKIVKIGSHYKMEAANETIVKVTVKKDSIKPRRVFFHSKSSTGWWKIHKFHYLYSQKSKADLKSIRSFSLPAGKNCLALFVAMCEQCSMYVTLINNENDDVPLGNIFSKNQQWEEVKLFFNLEKRHEKLYLQITTQRNGKISNTDFWAFDGARSCAADELRVLTPFYAYEPYWKGKCQLLQNGQTLGTTKNEVSSLENWEKCRENEFGENCLSCELVYGTSGCPEKSKYCQIIETKDSDTVEKCYCSIGYLNTTTCSVSCDAYSYGHSCQRKCLYCEDDCDHINGDCKSDRCSFGYAGKKCDLVTNKDRLVRFFGGDCPGPATGIYIFNEVPKVEIGETSCNLSMTSFAGSGKPNPPPYYIYQYRQENAHNWQDVGERILKFAEKESVLLEGLEAETTYSVRVIGFNTIEDLNGIRHDSSQYSSKIKTKQFTTLCRGISEARIIVVPEPFSARFWIRPSINGNLCPEYKFTFNDRPVPKKEYYYFIDNLEPFRNYSISVKRNNDLALEKCFQTLESTPGLVPNFNYKHTNVPTTVLLKWSKPSKPNGKLLYYTINIKLHRHLDCLQEKASEAFDIYVPAENEALTLENLTAYSDYNIAIKANTSAGFGSSIFLTVITDPAEIPNQEEIPKYINYYAFENGANIIFNKVSCEQKSGPLYLNTTILGDTNWCNNNKTSLTFTANQLIVQNLFSFCNYSVNYRFYRGISFFEGVTVNFTTKESAPHRIEELKVTEKGKNYISLRWLPPFPPTGVLQQYRITYCNFAYRQKYWYPAIIIKPTKCSLWPALHCASIPKLQEDKIYIVQVEAKNEGNNTYSEPVETDVRTNDDDKSEPPYNLSMTWTEDNDLFLTWYHPNATNGNLTEFKIYVNGIYNAETLYEIKSYKDYRLVYNTTIKNKLFRPGQNTIGISAHNKAGDSTKANITGESPLPIPHESIIDIGIQKNQISIALTQLEKSNFKKFLHILLTKCKVCEEQLNSYRSRLIEHYKTDDSPHQWDQPEHWTLLKVFVDWNTHLYVREDINNNNLCLEPNTTYQVSFIWIYQRNSHVTSQLNLTSVAIPPTPEQKSSNVTLVILLILLILVLAAMFGFKGLKTLKPCARAEQNHNESSLSLENIQLTNMERKKLKSERKYENLLLEDTAIFPGDPMFKTTYSRRIKRDCFADYVENVIKSDELQKQHELFPGGATKSCNYGRSVQNKPKNRYNDIIPYDHSRVVLTKIDGIDHSDYINANYIDGYRCPKAYIATQGPKKNTVYDFWRMIWQEKVKYIVMLANIYEGGKKKLEPYWPNTSDKIIVGDFTINFLEIEIHSNYHFRRFEVQHRGEKRKVGQMHFTAWPDHGVPLYPQTLVPILKKMLTFDPNNFPIVVHCSAGIGRTGTIILTDICLRMAAADGYVDVLGMLEHIRNFRSNLVDNVQQYKLVHLVILNCLEGLRTNVKVDDNFALKVQSLSHPSMLATQLQYIRNCEWQDDAMKSVSLTNNEEMPLVHQKNRFSIIIPDNTARVLLRPYPMEPFDMSSTYINAVRVDGFCQSGQFIVTQYPLSDTVGDFWRLVAEQDISVIACLNEIPVNDNSCGEFFPTKRMYDFTPVEIISVRVVEKRKLPVYTMYTFQMKVSASFQEAKTRMVKLCKFRGWDKSEEVPNYLDFVSFVDQVTTHQGPNAAKESPPILVSCYNGATASGLFIAMSFLIEEIKLEDECNVCQAIRSIRKSRKQFTNSEAQLRFLYKASLHYVDEKLSHYSNINI